MTNRVHWIKDEGKTYCISEPHEVETGALLCEPQPSEFHSFNMRTKKWEYSPTLYRSLKTPIAEKAISKAQLAWMFSVNTEDKLMISSYIQSIQKCLEEGKGEFPEPPAILNENRWNVS